MILISNPCRENLQRICWSTVIETSSYLESLSNPIRDLEGKMKEPVRCRTIRWSRQPASADVELEGLMEQLRLAELRVTLAPPLDKLLLCRARLEVQVGLLLVRYGRVGYRLRAAALGASGRVVVAGPDPEMVGEGEEGLDRVVAAYKSNSVSKSFHCLGLALMYRARWIVENQRDLQIVYVATGEVAPGGTNITVEKRVSAEDIC